MSSSKVILIGAISVVFGLYSLSLTRVSTYVGSTAENTLYISKANDNAKSGVQRCLNVWSRGPGGGGAFYTSETRTLLDGSVTYTVTTDKTFWSGYWSGDTVRMTITSRGVYKAPGEPDAFQGHEVVRTAYAKFKWVPWSSYSGWPSWYDVMYVSGYSTVTYSRERQLDSLQQFRNNLVGY